MRLIINSSRVEKDFFNNRQSSFHPRKTQVKMYIVIFLVPNQARITNLLIVNHGKYLKNTYLNSKNKIFPIQRISLI